MRTNTINPILLRELRGRMRTARSFWLLSGFLAMVAGTALLIYAADYASNQGQMATGDNIGRNVFLVLMTAAMIALSFVAPVLAAGSIAGERERQTFDLLLTTQLTVRQIIFGKIVASLSYCLLLLAAMTPLMGMVFLIGSVDVTQLIVMLSVIISHVVLLTCIGVYWSVRASSPLNATGMTLATVLFLLLGLPLLVVTLSQIIAPIAQNQTVRDLVIHITLSIHPFVVLFVTDEIMRSQQLWGQSFSINGPTLFVPAMWILGICAAWAFSSLIMWRTLRRMRRFS